MQVCSECRSRHDIWTKSAMIKDADAATAGDQELKTNIWTPRVGRGRLWSADEVMMTGTSAPHGTMK